MPTLHHATLDRIDPATLYRIMVLRTDVFVFEQGIVSEPELDGRDLEPTTTQFWRRRTARFSRHCGCWPTNRHCISDGSPPPPLPGGQGLAGQLLEAVFEAFPAPIEISAQAYLEN